MITSNKQPEEFNQLKELESELLEMLKEKRTDLEKGQKIFAEFKDLTVGKEISEELQILIVTNIRRSIEGYYIQRREPLTDVFFQMLIDNFDKVLEAFTHKCSR